MIKLGKGGIPGGFMVVLLQIGLAVIVTLITVAALIGGMVGIFEWYRRRTIKRG